MNLKVKVRYGVLLVGILLCQRVVGQKTAPEYIRMPKDIECEEPESSLESNAGIAGTTSGSVGRLICWTSGKGSNHAKEIPLVSAQLKNEMLSTKDFGKLRITMESEPVPGHPNLVGSQHVVIKIRRDKLQAFREFLQH